FDGRPVNGDCRYRERIGYMPQLARFPENLTGRELIAMIRDLRGAAGPVDDELAAAFTLAPHLDKPLRALSGGTRQKLNAVLAMLFRPELLILDEPTAGLDPIASSVLKDRLLALRAEGRTCLVTSHVLSELEELADDVAFLLAIFAIGNRNAFGQQFVEVLVVVGHVRRSNTKNVAQRLLASIFRHVGIDAGNGTPKPLLQNHRFIRGTLRPLAAG
ncbi:MAG: hypothetical protein B7Z72_13775, partial [Gemmatimonadetes bacterium 21-71-4]